VVIDIDIRTNSNKLLDRKHVEFFPHNFKLDCSLIRKLRAELDWSHAGMFHHILTMNIMI
jgi:hypothetical protein